jgi:hypothetical protein
LLYDEDVDHGNCPPGDNLLVKASQPTVQPQGITQYPFLIVWKSQVIYLREGEIYSPPRISSPGINNNGKMRFGMPIVKVF